jgi:hypothetical protein
MNNDNPTSYEEFLEQLKIEIGDFLRYAECGKTVRHQSLRSRKKSLRLRALLKEFRIVSLRQEKKINDIYKQAKNRIGKI